MKNRQIVATKLIMFVLIAAAFLEGCNSGSVQQRAQSLLTQPPMRPGIFVRVQPDSGETVSLSFPGDWPLSNSYTLTPDTGTICAEVQVQPLLEPGDQLSQVDNIELLVDESIADDSSSSHYIVDMEVCLMHEGEPPGCGPVTDIICWTGILDAGIHMADLRVWSTSGSTEYSYSWAFEVTE